MLIEKAYELQTQKSLKSIKHMLYIQGLPCNIFFPVTEDSIYNDSSQNYTYNLEPNFKGRFLITGIFEHQGGTPFGLEGYSAFGDDDFKMYIWEEEHIEIPRNSKIEVLYNNALKIFRTQDTDIQYGLDGRPVYGIINLIPEA